MTNGKQIAVPLVAALVVVAAIVATARRSADGPQLTVVPRAGLPGRFETRFPIMGTDARLEAAAPDEKAARRMFEAALAQFETVNGLMSTYAPDSEISRLNREGAEAAVPLSEHSLAVLAKAAETSELTGGAFDVTYAPLRSLWREAHEAGSLPSDADVEATLEKVGHGKLQVEGDAARLAAPGMLVDLGGIAKGYAIDLAAEAMRREGTTSGIVDVGGDLRFIGLRDGGTRWRVQMRSPPEIEEVIILQLPECAVATSGDYARFFTVEGQRFSHIVDPRTGRPVTDAPSVTVVAPDAVTADALATALSVIGPEEGIPLVESLPGVECYMMTRRPDDKIDRDMSSGFGAFLEG